MIHLLLLVALPLFAQTTTGTGTSTYGPTSLSDQNRIDAIDTTIQALISGKQTITGIPQYLNGFCFADGTCQTTSPGTFGSTVSINASLIGVGLFTSPLGVNSSSVPVFQSGKYPPADGFLITNLTGGNVTGNISGTAGNVSGIVAVLNGGTGSSTASGARTNLGAAASFVGISSSCPAGTFLSTGTWANGVTAGGGCVAAALPTNWAPSGGTIGNANECDQLTFNASGLLTATNAPQLCALSESQITNLTSDLGAKLNRAGPDTFIGNLTITATGLGANGLTVGNGGGISAYTLTTTTGITTGGASSTISGNLNVGTGSFPGNIYALSATAGLIESNTLALFDASAGTATLQATGGARFGCNSGISSGCGVQTINSDGKIPALDAAHFDSLDISAATGTPSFLNNYVPKTGGTMTGILQMSNGLGSANNAGNIVFSDQFYHTMQFKQTSGPQGWPNGSIQFVQGGTGMHRITSWDSSDTAANAFPGVLGIGADSTSGSTGIGGVIINGNASVTPDLYVTTYTWVVVGSTNLVSGTGLTSGHPGLYVGGPIFSTGTIKFQQGVSGIGITWADGTTSTTSAGSPGGTAGGELAGTYPNPTLSGTHVGNFGVTSGVILSSTSMPTISCTGGTGTLSVDSTNQAGSMLFGTGSTSCTVTFSGSGFPHQPSCFCNDQNGTLAIQAQFNTGAVSCTGAIALSGSTINYFCWGRPQ